MHFNTYEDMEKATANVRLGLETPNTDFLAAMIDVFGRELESECEKVDEASYEAGFEAGEYSGYEDGYATAEVIREECEKEAGK